MKRTIEIEDTLHEREERAQDSLKDSIKWNVKDGKIPDYYDITDMIFEAADVATPIYTKEIADAWYLYSYELTAAYEDAGIGKNPRENNGMTAICIYLEQHLFEYIKSEEFEKWYEETTGQPLEL